jgi:hypothetical protein
VFLGKHKRGGFPKGDSRSVCGRALERRTPRELAESGVLRYVRHSEELERVKAQELRLALPYEDFGQHIRRKANGKWEHHSGNAVIPFERGKLRRGNPKSAVSMKQGSPGFEGRKPSRG